ncbi:hypothetical protein [Paraburkholderia heleia]
MSEVVHLKVTDIDSKHMVIRVNQGKNLKCSRDHLRLNVLPKFML